MKIELTTNEMKCLALQQLGLEATLQRRGGFIILKTPHVIEVLNDVALEESPG